LDQAARPDLTVYSRDPFNAGTPAEALARSYVTETELCYVRSHAPVPAIDPTDYRLTVGGEVGRALSLSLDELRGRFPRHTLVATLQCAGNRRTELIDLRPIPGEVPWGNDAISTARWGGVRLRDVLLSAGLGPGTARHVAFAGLDEVEKGGRRFAYGGSIPIDKALGDEVLLADEMNGAPLTLDHGYPLRVVVPGYIGARSVKWLSGIRVQPEPSDNYFQAHAYKLFPPEVSAETADWSLGEMLGELRVDSVILQPAAGAAVPAGRTRVVGYAMAGGGHGVERVELSKDGGRTWAFAAAVEKGDPWAWRHWSAEIDLPAGNHELVVRAWDTTGATQPADPRKTWNFKGYMNNCWHRVPIRAE
jgi:sulfite oxidase